MKQSGECPKCASTQIWNDTHIPDWSLGYTGTVITRLLFIGKKKTGRIRKQLIAAKYVVYVCLDCGLTERYVDKEGLDLIREHGTQ